MKLAEQGTLTPEPQGCGALQTGLANPSKTQGRGGLEHSTGRVKNQLPSTPRNMGKTGYCTACVTTGSKSLESGGIEVGCDHQQETRAGPWKGDSVFCSRTSQRAHAYQNSAFSEGCWQLRQRARGQNRGRRGYEMRREVGTEDRDRAMSVSYNKYQR